jgi:hypothetical protein
MELYHGVKRPEREAVCAPPSSAKLRMTGAAPPLRQMIHYIGAILLCGFRDNQRRQKVPGMFLTPYILQVVRSDTEVGDNLRRCDYKHCSSRGCSSRWRTHTTTHRKIHTLYAICTGYHQLCLTLCRLGHQLRYKTDIEPVNFRSAHPKAIASREHASRANVTDVEVWLRGLEIQAVSFFVFFW